jgi:predicted KAP-like P-loop ATPase
MEHIKIVVNSSGKGDELFVLFEKHTNKVISINQYYSMIDKTVTIPQNNGLYNSLLNIARNILDGK